MGHCVKGIITDKRAFENFNPEDFTLELGKETFENKRLDVSGRVHVPTAYLEKIGLRQHVTIKCVPKNKIAISFG